jgi:hypothetical protein
MGRPVSGETRRAVRNTINRNDDNGIHSKLSVRTAGRKIKNRYDV